MGVVQQSQKIDMAAAEARFKDLKLVPGINLNSISAVTPEWLDGYMKASEREIHQLYKDYDPREARRHEVQVIGRVDHVKHLCSIIFASREGIEWESFNK